MKPSEKSVEFTPFGEGLLGREFSGIHTRVCTHSAETEMALHSHSTTSLCVVLDGSCTEQYGRRTREYELFDSEFLPAHQAHGLKFRAFTRCFVLEIAPQWLEKVQEYGLRLGDGVHSKGGVLVGLLLKAYREFRTADEASCLAVQGLTAEMLAHVSRYSSAAETKCPRWLQQVKEMLHAQFSERLGLCAVAQEVDVHPGHLAREFRKHFGRTLGQYVRELRIQQSMVDLAGSRSSLADISSGAGFADQSHFSRVFKAHTGLTPREYRRAFAIRHQAENSSE